MGVKIHTKYNALCNASLVSLNVLHSAAVSAVLLHSNKNSPNAGRSYCRRVNWQSSASSVYRVVYLGFGTLSGKRPCGVLGLTEARSFRTLSS
jgi:hypothetical protein